MVYHTVRAGKLDNLHSQALGNLSEEAKKLREHAKTVRLDGPAKGAAFTIGGGKIFFLTREARDHLIKIGRWTETSFSFDQ